MIELMLQAERALMVGMVDQAERLYQMAARNDPRNAIAVVGLARVALERGDDRGAYDLSREALAIDPENPAALRLEARLSEVLTHRGETVERPAFVLVNGDGPAAARAGTAAGRKEPFPPAPRRRGDGLGTVKGAVMGGNAPRAVGPGRRTPRSALPSTNKERSAAASAGPKAGWAPPGWSDPAGAQVTAAATPAAGPTIARAGAPVAASAAAASSASGLAAGLAGTAAAPADVAADGEPQAIRIWPRSLEGQPSPRAMDASSPSAAAEGGMAVAMPGPTIDLTHGRTLAGGVPQSAAVDAPWAQPRSGTLPAASAEPAEEPFRIRLEPQRSRADAATPVSAPASASVPDSEATPDAPPRKSFLRRLFGR